MKVNFLYGGQIIEIQCTKNIEMKEVISKFEAKANIESNSVVYLCNGIKLNEEKKLEELLGNNDKNNAEIIVMTLDEIENNKNIKNNKYVKCPECQENILIKIKDYKVELYNCKNKHKIDNIFLEEYEKTQKKYISKIVCQKYNDSNISNTYENKFFLCNSCKLNLCPLCKSSHDINHNIINYEQRDFICEIHNEIYTKYCDSCNQNLCLQCTKEHNNHKIILYDNIIPDIDKIKKSLINLKNAIDLFKSDIQIMINKLNEVIKNIDIYYNINYNLF